MTSNHLHPKLHLDHGLYKDPDSQANNFSILVPVQASRDQLTLARVTNAFCVEQSSEIGGWYIVSVSAEESIRTIDLSMITSALTWVTSFNPNSISAVVFLEWDCRKVPFPRKWIRPLGSRLETPVWSVALSPLVILWCIISSHWLK